LRIVVALIACVVAAIPCQAKNGARISIRLYDAVGVPRQQRETAVAIAAGLLSAASIEADWRFCGESGLGDPAPEIVCDQLLAAGEKVVRIIRGPRPPRKLIPEPLGEATIDPARAVGTLATVYYDRVVARAQIAEVDVDLLFGRVMAHELGHLLLGTTGHSPSGLMRRLWTVDQLRMGPRGDWEFCPNDLAKLARSLQKLP